MAMCVALLIVNQLGLGKCRIITDSYNTFGLLTKWKVDNMGLDGADRRYLMLMAEHYAGGPVGIETLSAALSESRDALEEVIEPYLMQRGLVQRTPRGRILAQSGWAHLGLTPPKSQGDLLI